MKFYSYTAPAAWASYFVNGDASGLTVEERDQADAWRRENKIANVVDVARDADGDGIGPRFTWHFQLYAPQTPYQGGEVVDYICEIR